MATITKFEDMKVWQMARVFCKDVFRITNYDAFAKDFRLKDQLKASSGSIMDNIAEGFERNGNKEFTHFLSIAKGSCGEARSQLHRALDFAYIHTDEFNLLYQKTEEFSKSISGFIQYLKACELKGTKFK